MMKKLFLSLAVLLCCALTTTVFTSCGDDDDNSSVPAQSKVVAYEVHYSLNLPYKESTENTGNIFDLCEKVEIGYTDENGEEQWEDFDVKVGKWSKIVTYKSAFSSTLKFHLIKKENLEYQYERYTFNGNDATVMPNSLGNGIFTIHSDGKRIEGAAINKYNKDGDLVWKSKDRLENLFDNSPYIYVFSISTSI